VSDDWIVLVSGREDRGLVFAGDVALAPANGDLIGPVLDDALAGALRAAFAVANLEAPLAGHGAAMPKAGPAIYADARMPDWLRTRGFDAVGLANNHAMDHGWPALAATIDACAIAGVASFGAGVDEAAAAAPLIVDVDGRSVALLAACEHEFGIAGPSAPGVAWVSHPDLEARVAAAAAEHALVVVCAHGGHEEVPAPAPQRRAQLRRLVAAGAGVVIGHHPHTPQGWEQWGTGWIFHSLGDFCFAGADGGDRRGYLVRVSADGPDHGLAVLPYRRDGDIVRAPDAGTASALPRLAEVAASPDLDALWQELAMRLWDQRYRQMLATATGAEDPYHVYLRIARLRARLTGRRPAPPVGVVERERSLLLTLLLRCESHRWAIETAQALRGGLEADRRTDRERGLADELLAVSGFGA
jgi:poly-gamma-glutamate synthesis protein (capsule biosynthesis protein)